MQHTLPQEEKLNITLPLKTSRIKQNQDLKLKLSRSHHVDFVEQETTDHLIVKKIVGERKRIWKENVKRLEMLLILQQLHWKKNPQQKNHSTTQITLSTQPNPL